MNSKNFDTKNQANENDRKEIINLYSSGKLVEAKNKVVQLLKKYPNDPVLYNLLGAILAEQNNLDDAIANCKKSIQIKSLNTITWFRNI